MKIKLLRSYRNANGNIVFVYKVTGSKSNINTFCEIQGEYLKYEDDDENNPPLYFTLKYAGDTGALVFNKDNTKVIVDTTEENKLLSLMEQHKGTALGDALAAQIATKMMSSSTKPAPSPVPDKVDATKKAEPTADLDAL